MPWGAYTVGPVPGGSIAGNGLLSPVLLDPTTESHVYGPPMLSLDVDQQHVNIPPGITIVTVDARAFFDATAVPTPGAGELAAELSFTGEDPESTFSATNPAPGSLVEVLEGTWPLGPAPWTPVVAFPSGGQALWRVSNASVHDPLGFETISNLNFVWVDNAWDIGEIGWPQPVF